MLWSLKDDLDDAARLAADPAWEDLRLKMAHRFLGLMLPILAITSLRHIWSRPALMAATLSALVLTEAARRWLTRRPRSRQAVVRSLGGIVASLVFLGILMRPVPGLAPAMAYAPAMGVLGLILDGPSLGLLMLAGALAACGLQWQLSADPAVRQGVIMVLTASVTLFGVALAWHRVLRRGFLQLYAAKAELEEQWVQRQALTRELFGRQVTALEKVAELLRAPGPADWQQLHSRLQVLQSDMEQVRDLRRALPEAVAHPLRPKDFVREVLRFTLYLSLGAALVGWADHLLTGAGHALTAPLAAAMLAMMIFTLRGGRPARLWMRLSVALMGPVLMALDALHTQAEIFPPALHFWCLSIFNTGLLLGLAPAGAVMALGMALLAYLSIGYAGAGEWPGLQVALSMAMSWLVVLGTCVQAGDWQRELIERLARRGQELAASLRVRRRLIGALHHDLGNLLTGLQGAASLGRAGMSEPSDHERCRRLCARMQALLASGEDALLSDAPVRASQISKVLLDELAEAMQDLYTDRLLAKRVTLTAEVPPGLMAWAAPGLLRDCVLSNLVSNAIKFSRPGSQVRLTGWAEAGTAVLAVLDHGPGLPEEALQALRRGDELPSREGTSGELGQGLGLQLAKEQLQRQGGSLELRAREGGGTEAVMRLPLAS